MSSLCCGFLKNSGLACDLVQSRSHSYPQQVGQFGGIFGQTICHVPGGRGPMHRGSIRAMLSYGGLPGLMP